MRIRDWSSDVCSSDLLGAGHYPIIVGVHAALLVVLFLAVDRETPILWAPFVLFLLLQMARLWVIASLGRYWTTRIIAVPHAPLVRRGPYRWVRHPNYLIVIAERSEEHTSELQSLMRISYAVFCLKKKK